MALPALDEALHLLVLVIDVVFNLLRELFESVDKVVGAVRLVDLGELGHFLIAHAREHARIRL